MFAKKFLSILGLFLIAGHLANAVITSITITGNVCTIDGGDAGDDGTLYIVSAEDGNGPFTKGSTGEVKKIVKITSSGTDCEFETNKAVDLCVDDDDIVRKRNDGICKGTYASGDCKYITCDGENVCEITSQNVAPRSGEQSGGNCNVEDETATCEEGYYLVESALYYCDGTENGCGNPLQGSYIPIGYLVNKYENDKPYIKCYISGNDRVCTNVNVLINDGSSCDAVGKLYESGGKNYLCLDGTDNAVDLSTDEGKYMIPLGSGSGLFGIAGNASTVYYLVVKVDSVGNVTLVKETTPVRYRYTATDASEHTNTLYKVYGRTEAQAEISTDAICDSAGAKPFEFMLDQWTDEDGEHKPSLVDYYIVGDNTHLNN